MHIMRRFGVTVMVLFLVVFLLCSCQHFRPETMLTVTQYYDDGFPKLEYQYTSHGGILMNQSQTDGAILQDGGNYIDFSKDATQDAKPQRDVAVEAIQQSGKITEMIVGAWLAGQTGGLAPAVVPKDPCQPQENE